MVDLISHKRNGLPHTKDEIDFVISGIMGEAGRAHVADYQLAAWLMAVCWRGMTMDETAQLTKAMAESGQVLDLSAIGPIVGDKHSTGGVGDKTTLVFVPLLASAGIPMAKLSGRGLGHTGGTIDKLEAIPGFQTDLPIDRFIKQIKEIGCAISGQTPDLAPADGKIYAMRDVTATVESIPLIAASVMSKKIAAGANLIILDVKCGAGAFMETEADATSLAKTMAEVGRRLGKPVSAVVTDMEQPLGFAIGHSLEVKEAIDTLKGEGPADLTELTYTLGALALMEAGKAKTEEQAASILKSLIESGAALAKFKQLIVAQGGDAGVIDNPSLMPTARIKYPVVADGDLSRGKLWIKHINGKRIAEACKLMGGGRAHKGDAINLATGVVLHGKVGSAIESGQAVATIYADSEEERVAAEKKLMHAIEFSDKPVAASSVIKSKISLLNLAK
jgi:pyrimidine-nucleoside phosphorylase